jgi:hypothetical protein
MRNISQGLHTLTSWYVLRVSMGGEVNLIKPTALALLYIKFKWDYYFIIIF